MELPITAIAQQYRLVGCLGLKVASPLAATAHLLLVVVVIVVAVGIVLLFGLRRRGGGQFGRAEANAKGVPARRVCGRRRLRRGSTLLWAGLVLIPPVPFEPRLLQ